MGRATLPILGAVVGTVIAPGVGTVIGAGLGAAAGEMTKTPNTPAPAPQAAPVAPQPADPVIAASTAKSNADNIEAQRQRALKVNTLMSDPANPTSGVANYG